MAAAVYDFNVDQGSTLIQTFQWTDSSGAAVNLTGYTAKMQVRSGYADSGAAVLLELSTTLGTITITAATGTVTLNVPAATTTAFTWDSGIYDLELTSGAGVVTRLVQGSIYVNKEVTR